MKVLVIGATGRTGEHAVRQLLAHGDNVAAFARRPKAVTEKSSRLQVVPGDTRDAAAIESALKGQEAVLMAFGPRSSDAMEVMTYARYRDDLAEITIRNVIAAMKKHGVKRLVNLSSWGLAPALLGFVSRNIVIPLLAGKVLADKQRGETLLFASGLDYVNVRPGRLLDAPARGGVHASVDGRGLKQVITREDLAAFMIAQLGDSNWVGKSVYVGY